MRILALDVGTSSVRARVYDERGRPQHGAQAQTRYDVVHGRGGEAELDADHLVAAARAVYDETLREAGGDVDAVATSCFWHSLVAVEGYRAISPVFLWQDTRSAPQVDALRRELDGEAVWERTGCPLHTAYWPAVLRWLHEEQRETWERAERFLSFAEYLRLWLDGEPNASLSTASGTGLLDLASRDWDEEMLEAAGLTSDRLPLMSDDANGRWYPPIGDGACANVGADATTPQRACLSIGTSGALRTIAPAPAHRRGLFRYYLDAGRLVTGGSLSDGGNLYAWLERMLGEVRTDGFADREPDGHGLTFLPFLGGERATGWNPRARGVVAGLTFDTTREEVVHAALEAVAHRFAAVAELMPEVEEVVATGGAALASPEWLQIIADALGLPVTASAVEESSARGAAVVALERLGASPEPAPRGRTYEPRPARHDRYREARERQETLYARLREDPVARGVTEV